jgi:DNA-binding transcriptional MerR regulator
VAEQHVTGSASGFDAESFARKLALGFPIAEIEAALRRRGAQGDELSRLVELAAELQRARDELPAVLEATRAGVSFARSALQEVEDIGIALAELVAVEALLDEQANHGAAE